MKRNIIYLIGYLLIGVMMTGCNHEDALQYSDLTIDKEYLMIDLDQAAEESIHIINGNGNYKLTLSNDKVATVAINNNTILVTGLEPGKTDIMVTDWAKKSSMVKVEVKRLEELILDRNGMSLFIGETGTTSVYSGNGDYSISSSDEAVARGTVDENGNIAVEALAKG
ncbi:MAG: Ig-like domain-containing protein, partial [Tannerella sp.]|nr:Ig-like domain-containing protein [Tannerella sp.]